MVVQFFKGGRTCKGAKSAISYLLDKRVSDGTAKVYKGNADLTLKIIANNNRAWKFTSGVISFEESYEQVKNKLDDIVKDFEKTFFCGLTEEQYNTLYVLHTDKGRAELHFIIPRVELTTGKDLSIYTHKKDLPKKDLFQQYINNKFNLTNPLDKGKKRTLEMVTKWSNEAKELKKELHNYIEKSFEKGLINSRDEIIELLKQAGFDVKVSKKYISVKTNNMKRAIRLKGVFYEESYTSNTELARKFTGAGNSNQGDTQTALAEIEQKLRERIFEDAKENRKRYKKSKQQDFAGDKREIERPTRKKSDKELRLGDDIRNNSDDIDDKIKLHNNGSKYGRWNNSSNLDKKIIKKGDDNDERIRNEIDEYDRRRKRREQERDERIAKLNRTAKQLNNERKRREQERERRIKKLNDKTKQLDNKLARAANILDKLITRIKQVKNIIKNVTTKNIQEPTKKQDFKGIDF